MHHTAIKTLAIIWIHHYYFWPCLLACLLAVRKTKSSLCFGSNGVVNRLEWNCDCNANKRNELNENEYFATVGALLKRSFFMTPLINWNPILGKSIWEWSEVCARRRKSILLTRMVQRTLQNVQTNDEFEKLQLYFKGCFIMHRSHCNRSIGDFRVQCKLVDQFLIISDQH